MRVSVKRHALDRFIWKIQTFEKAMPVLRDRVSFYMAEKALETIQGHIDRQDLGWQPLSPDYVAEKARKGLDGRTWIATGELRTYIQIQKRYYGYAVGIPREAWHSGANMPAWKLARVHEYGQLDLGIPARPLFRPSMMEVKRWWSGSRRSVAREYMRNYAGVSLRTAGTVLESGQSVADLGSTPQIEIDFGNLF